MRATLRHGQQRKGIALKRMAGSHAQAYARMRGAQIFKKISIPSIKKGCRATTFLIPRFSIISNIENPKKQNVRFVNNAQY